MFPSKTLLPRIAGAIRISSERMQRLTASPAPNGDRARMRIPPASTAEVPFSLTTTPSTMFSIPTNRATSRLAGRVKTSRGVPTCENTPFISTPIRWASRWPWYMSWVEKTIVVPRSRLIRTTRFSIIATETGSRFAVGSSRRRISGSITIARASATRCISPPESVLARRSR